MGKMEVPLTSFFKGPELCIVRNEMCVLVIIRNSSKNKECPGEALYGGLHMYNVILVMPETGGCS